MITAQYKRDLKNSYLILPVHAEAAQSYQMQMISRNKIDGLLPCQLRTEGETESCWYEISSKQSLQHIFAASEINYEELKNLLTGIYIILQKLEQYLLQNACLLLEPEYIYMDMEQRKIYLVYLPQYEGNSFTAIKHLAEYILSRVNHTDEQAVKLAYHFYQCAREDNFSFQHLAAYIENQNGRNRLPEQERKQSYERKSVDALPERIDREDTITDTAGYDCYETGKERKAAGKEIQNRILFAGIAGTMVIIATGVYLAVNYHLQVQEKAAAAGIVAVFYAVIAAAYLHYGRQDEKAGKEDVEKKEEDTYYEEAGRQEEEYGNTMFFGSETAVGQHYLEGEHKGNKIHYEIEKEQIMIGKMEGKVDVVLRDTSVSRLHAEIYQRSGKLLLKDLHSTNGTYKNGVLLQPEEIVELKSLDELRFGRICLTYH